jgi:hypothetical protein
MADFEGERWVELYKNVLVEVEHAKMRGRVEEARAAIDARVEKLRVPGLHAEEYQAIENALNALGFLKQPHEP